MARKTKNVTRMKRLLEHTQVKPLPEWKHAFTAHRKIQKMTDKQFQVYSACIDHARGKSDIKKFFPLGDVSHIEELKKHDKDALDSLARNLGSKQQLSRWHRKLWSNASEKKAGGYGSALKSLGKGAVRVGKYIVSKGVQLAKAAWSTTKKFVQSMGRLGKKALKWVIDPANVSKIAGLIDLVKQGVSVAKLIADMGQAGPIPESELATVSDDKKKSVASVMDASDATSGDDSEDDGVTVGEMGED